MHATFRRIRTQPGKAAEVGSLIADRADWANAAAADWVAARLAPLVASPLGARAGEVLAADRAP